MAAIDNYSGPMRNPITWFIFFYFAQVAAPRHGVSDWDFDSDFQAYGRFNIDFSAVVDRVNNDLGKSMQEWFDIPKYFRQQYTKGLSQSSLDLDSNRTELYRANV
jgi:hypothetical protein